MYYLIEGETKGLENDHYTFEFVVKADSVEEAKAQLEDYEECLKITEMTVEQCIEREKQSIIDNLISVFKFRKYGNMSVREFSKMEREINADPEKYYALLKESGKWISYENRLLRALGDKDISLNDYFQTLFSMMDAKTDEELLEIINFAKSKARLN